MRERAPRPQCRKAATPPDEQGDGNQREEMDEEDDLEIWELYEDTINPAIRRLNELSGKEPDVKGGDA